MHDFNMVKLQLNLLPWFHSQNQMMLRTLALKLHFVKYQGMRVLLHIIMIYSYCILVFWKFLNSKNIKLKNFQLLKQMKDCCDGLLKSIFSGTENSLDPCILLQVYQQIKIKDFC